MHIACLQFAPQLGKANENIARADALLNASPPQTLDILMLPELSFTGLPLRAYNTNHLTDLTI